MISQRENPKTSIFFLYFTDQTFPLLNRTIASEFSPGSIFKPIVTLAGLQSGFITPSTSFYCNGKFELKSITFKCWNKWGHGEMNLNHALEQSCNVYYYQVSQEIGFKPIHSMASRFQFGQKTGIPLIGEKSGLLPSPQWKTRRFKTPSQQKWHLGDTINFSIGQGFLLTTPMQMAMMTATIAHQGVGIAPQLVTNVVSAAGNPIPLENEPITFNTNVPKEHLKLVQKGMHDVIHGTLGTGKKSNCRRSNIGG